MGLIISLLICKHHLGVCEVSWEMEPQESSPLSTLLLPFRSWAPIPFCVQTCLKKYFLHFFYLLPVFQIGGIGSVRSHGLQGHSPPPSFQTDCVRDNEFFFLPWKSPSLLFSLPHPQFWLVGLSIMPS